MNHYVYEVTNNINGRKYIGKRSCNCPIEKDMYFGSGIAIKEALKKYGVKNFSKDIIKVFNTSKEAFEYEEYLIDKLDCVNDIKYYNVAKGGIGGVGTLEGKTELEKWEIYNRMRDALKGKMAGENNPMYGRRGKDNPNYKRYVPIETREKISEALKGKPFTEEHKENIRKSRIGMKLSEQHKRNIGLGVKGKMAGDKNPMYGIKGEKHPNSKKVICLNNLKIFNSTKEACDYVSLKGSSDISKACMGKRNFAGRKELEPIKWMYLEDYNYCIKNSIDFDLYKKEKYHK